MLKFLFARPNCENGQWLDVPAGAEVFSYHKKSAGRVLLAGFLLAAAAETVTLHIILTMWNHWVAWAATLLSLWFALQVIAQIRAFALRPIYIHQDRLMIRNGAFDLVEIGLREIELVGKSTGISKWDSGGLPPLKACFPVEHNVYLQLKQPGTATILNLRQRKFKTALLFLDEPEGFVARIAADQSD